MTFDADSASVQDARPAELYTIVTPTTTYYLTSYTQDVVFGGHTYTAGAIGRDTAPIGKVGQGRDLTIMCSLDHALAQDLLVGGLPWSDVTVTLVVLMQRSLTTRQLWLGHVADIATDGLKCKLRVPELVDDYVSNIRLPVLSTQRLCPHALYDAGCTLNQNAFAVTTSVSSISVDGLTIGVGSVGGHADQYYQYGKMLRSADGEARSIVSHTGTNIVIDVAYRTLTVGDTIGIYAGCDHTITTCTSKFSNRPNYGGMPHLPLQNLFSPVRRMAGS